MFGKVCEQCFKITLSQVCVLTEHVHVVLLWYVHLFHFNFDVTYLVVFKY